MSRRCRVVVVSVVGLVGLVIAGSPARAADQRSYAAAQRPQLELAGEKHLLPHASGGTAVGEVVVQSGGDADPYPKKHLGSVRYEDVVVRFQPGQFTQAVADTLQQPDTRHDGVLDWLDANFRSVRRQAFEDALLTGITFPAMDGASKEAGYITVTLSPDGVTNTAGDGSTAKSSVGGGGKAKQWVAANFRVSVPGVDASTVKRVEPIEVRIPAATHAAGDARHGQKVPGRVEVGNVKLLVADAEPWAAWHDDFVVKGHNDDGQERTLTIELLSPDMKSAVMTLQAKGVGIVAVRPRSAGDSGGVASEKLAQTEVELYAERLEVHPAKGASAQAAPKAAEAPPAAADAEAKDVKPSAAPSEAIRKRPAVRERVR